MTLDELRVFLEARLRNDIVPFWLKHAIDRERGGIFSCIRDDGTIVSRDKYIWSQARGLWTFSALYNRIEPREEWLDVAHGLFRFLKQFGRDENGCWVFTTDEFGKVIQGEDSIVTDAFAIMGLTEYATATGNDEAKRIAQETYGSVCERLARPGTYKTAPYPTPPGMKAHRERMQFSLAFYFLGKVLGDEVIREHGMRLGREVLDHFVRWDRQVLLEYLDMDSQPQDSPAGRCMVPGHGIESCYFQILIFSDAGQLDQVQRACEPIRWCLEKGWDAKHGGLFLGIDVEGRQPAYWRHADLKLWWPHAEALAACLLAYEQCRESWCLDWYWKVHEWSFRHFPDREHGEWTQRLDRQGNKVDTLVALPVKDPFHLPRALIVAIQSLRRVTPMLENEATAPSTSPPPRSPG